MGTPLPPHIHAVPTTQIPVKVGPVGVMKVYGGSGGIAPRMLTLDTKMEVSGQVHPSVFFLPPGNEGPVSIRWKVEPHSQYRSFGSKKLPSNAGRRESGTEQSVW